MKPPSIAAASALAALAWLAPTAAAQLPCPFSALVAHTGAACSASGAQLPTLTASLTGPNKPCALDFALDVPPLCCNVLVVARPLVIGLQETSIPLSSGCTLLVQPLLVLDFPPVTSGTKTALALPLPPDPFLVGLKLRAQGGVVRFDTIAFATYVDVTDAAAIKFQ